MDGINVAAEILVSMGKSGVDERVDPDEGRSLHELQVANENSLPLPMALQYRHVTICPCCAAPSPHSVLAPVVFPPLAAVPPLSIWPVTCAGDFFFLLMILDINIVFFSCCFRTGYCEAYETQVLEKRNCCVGSIF